MKQGIYVLILANNLASFYDSREIIQGVPRVPKGAPRTLRRATQRYTSL